MDKRIFQITTLLLMFVGTAHAKQPNIVFILADDIGYADIGPNTDVPLPALQKLRAESADFTQAYATASFCGPSRAGIFTGVYQQRFARTESPGSNYEEYIPEEYPTMQENLKLAGYSTGYIGKWHLGASPQGRPGKKGIDDFVGFLGGGHSYQHFDLRPELWSGGGPILHNEDPITPDVQLTRFFETQSVEMLERLKEPFFLTIATNAPHTPLEPSKKAVKIVHSDQPSSERSLYLAHLVDLDTLVGKVLENLREQRLDKSTIVVFTNDNGGYGSEKLSLHRQAGPYELNYSYNDPYRGGKGLLLEGGIRVPLFIKKPGVEPRKIDDAVSLLDIAATFYAAAGTKAKADGRNLGRCLAGSCDYLDNRSLFWGSAFYPNPVLTDESFGSLFVEPKQRNKLFFGELNDSTVVLTGGRNKMLLSFRPGNDESPNYACELYDVDTDAQEMNDRCSLRVQRQFYGEKLAEWQMDMQCSMRKLPMDHIGYRKYKVSQKLAQFGFECP